MLLLGMILFLMLWRRLMLLRRRLVLLRWRLVLWRRRLTRRGRLVLLLGGRWPRWGCLALR